MPNRKELYYFLHSKLTTISAEIKLLQQITEDNLINDDTPNKVCKLPLDDNSKDFFILK